MPFDAIRRNFGGRRRFWATVPRTSLAVFLGGVFFTFASLGFLIDVSVAGQMPGWMLFARVVFHGAVAVCYAWGGIRDPRFFVLAITLQLLGQWSMPHILIPPGLEALAVKDRLGIDTVGTMLCVLFGYILIVGFISTVGRRHLRVQAEMALARAIHETLVPVLAATGAGYEAYGRSFPTTEVGGDLLDVVADHGVVTCYVADVSGHGVPAGTFMSMVKSAARMRLNRPALTSGGTADVLADLNRVLAPLKQPNMYATCAWLRLYDGQAEFALAGHPPILHYRRRTAEVTPLEVRNFPLAMLEDVGFDTACTAVGPGDVFALLTDGLIEVADGREQELGIEPLARVLAGHAARPLPELFERMMDAVRAHGPQQDDQTLLLVRVAEA